MGVKDKSIIFRNRDKGTLYFKCNQYSHKSFECISIFKDVIFPNEHSQINIGTNFRTFILKEVRLHSINLISLVDTGSQRTILKKSNFDKIKYYVKLDYIDMRFAD